MRPPDEDVWARFFRWGPYGLLALSTCLAYLSFDVMSAGGQELMAPVLAVTITLQILRTVGRVPGPVYFWARTVLAFVLTWLNPFFGIFAVIAYFDAPRLLKRGRPVMAGVMVNAVTMAGSQSGGLPPANAVVWALFGGLLVLHVTLLLVMTTLTAREERQTAAKIAMIEELERTNARLEQALRENAALHEQLLVQAREAGVNDERRRLAAEIHDTIAQGLAGIVTQLQAAGDTPDASREHIERAAALARESLREARRAVHNLAPAPLEHDTLPEALKKIVNTCPEAHLTVTGLVEPLHEEIEATLLRIAQEALANARRHAHASRIGVTLSYMDDEVTLDVRDDGRGFSEPGGGFGLNGMRERAERVLGMLEVESEPGQGTAISARLPLVRHA
ncbi:sensor histidine kinase [Actinomadura sp. NBRC 104412]|uniref:sensor histidine kinase n=1 Tax=Actinomadura sp. NBRC 104412 TaxID=3032203 RepID=UPI002554120B|nr:sensor histidine kinase [Actinomadura sp. NBRC 104412]